MEDEDMHMGETVSRAAVSRHLKKLGHRYGSPGYNQAKRELYVPAGDGTYYEREQPETAPVTAAPMQQGERIDVC